MSRPIIKRLAGLEKQMAVTVAAPHYPPIPSLAEQKRMSLQEMQELYDRVRRGEYSLSPEDVERHRKDRERHRALEEAGMSPADIYAEFIRESPEEVRRVFDSE